MLRVAEKNAKTTKGIHRDALALCFCVFCGYLLSFDISSEASQTAPRMEVTWEPAALVNGAPCLFRVAPATPLRSLSGTWLSHKVFFDFDSEKSSWFALAGVGVDQPPGSYPLQLEAVTQTGLRTSFSQPVTIGKASYHTIALSVGRQFTEPSAQQLEQIKRDQELKSQIFGTVTPTRTWSGNFAAPVDASTSEGFGTQRTFNGKRQSIHQGLDYRAPTGTPVAAMNAGMVILARPMFFEGNCVVIDHGQGLLSLYLHFSEFKVKEGDHVTRGQILGRSGATGRVTGPHLHVAFRWEGVYVNPATLLGLRLP